MRRQKTENRDRTTARRASGEKKSTKETKPDCRKGTQRRSVWTKTSRRSTNLTQLNKDSRQKGTVNSRQKSTANSRREDHSPTAGEKSTEEHSQQQARRAQPTAGEKSTEEHSQHQARRAQPTAGEKEHTQQQGRIKRTEGAVPTAG